mgnify:FL=1
MFFRYQYHKDGIANKKIHCILFFQSILHFNSLNLLTIAHSPRRPQDLDLELQPSTIHVRPLKSTEWEPSDQGMKHTMQQNTAHKRKIGWCSLIAILKLQIYHQIKSNHLWVLSSNTRCSPIWSSKHNRNWNLPSRHVVCLCCRIDYMIDCLYIKIKVHRWYKGYSTSGKLWNFKTSINLHTRCGSKN